MTQRVLYSRIERKREPHPIRVFLRVLGSIAVITTIITMLMTWVLYGINHEIDTRRNQVSVITIERSAGLNKPIDWRLQLGGAYDVPVLPKRKPQI